MITSGKFQKYKYDTKEENLEKYGSEEPPLFNTNNITDFNITLVCGQGDLLANKTDYDYLNQLLS